MFRLGWFLVGVLSVFVVVIVGATAFVMTARGFSANEPPTAVESWLAHMARSLALPADARYKENPVANSPEVLADARAHWADHCALCHANDGSGDTVIGKRLYPPAPDMRKPGTQKMTDGELFYTIQNGIRLSGMPAWGGSAQDEDDSWKLVHFIRHLPQVTVEEKKQMEKMNPKSPDDLKEEEQEERFLKGEDTNAQPIEHHHH